MSRIQPPGRKISSSVSSRQSRWAARAKPIRTEEKVIELEHEIIYRLEVAGPAPARIFSTREPTERAKASGSFIGEFHYRPFLEVSSAIQVMT